MNFDIYDNDDHNDCPLCAGTLLVLGYLGNRIHYRCRGCGYQCSWVVERLEPVELRTTH